MSGEVRDWKIVLVPREGEDPGGWLEIVRGDETDAIQVLELLAEVIELRCTVPRLGEWQNESACHIVRRSGKRSYAVRCDSFERETENGYSNGYGWLRVQEA